MSRSVKTVLAIVTAASSFALFPTGAYAVGDHECRDYAVAAIRQVHEMHEFRGCDRGQGPRWSDDWNVHYQWCRGASFEAIGAERDARTNWLRSCRPH